MVARVLSSSAWQMQAVAVGWQVYALTGSAFDLGLVGLAQFLPMAVLTLAAGHVADRYDRRYVAAICQAIEALCAVVLAAGSLGGWMTRDLILAVMFVFGTVRAFESPAISALPPMLVPPGLLHRALAFSTSANQAAFVVGPALGGLLYAVSPSAPYLVAAVSFAGAALALRGVVLLIPPVPRSVGGLREMFGGIGFIRREKVILGALSLDLFSVLLGGATALLPIYARDILHTGSWGLGFLRAAPAVGATLCSVLLSRHPVRRHVGPVMFAAVATYGLATLVFAVSSSFLLSLAALAIAGASDVVSVVIRVTLVQTLTPDAMRGRVSAVSSLFSGTSNQLGEFESGMTAALLGAVGSVLLGGFGTLAVCALYMALFPMLRRADQVHPPQ